MDPISNLIAAGDSVEVKGMLTKVVDFLKRSDITTILSSLELHAGSMEETDVGISSLMDTLILLRFKEEESKRKRILYILKSRGMEHPTDIDEYAITSKGIVVN